MAKKTGFNPWHTRAENLLNCGEVAPWNRANKLGYKKRPRLPQPVIVDVIFEDGFVDTMSTVFANKAGDPDTDALIRAAREARIMHVCRPMVERKSPWGRKESFMVPGDGVSTPMLERSTGMTHYLFLDDIPLVSKVTIRPMVYHRDLAIAA